MRIDRDNFEIHISRGVGSTLEDLLRSARERIWIVSPWISEEYASFLTEKNSQGLDVQLVTSLESSNRDAFRELLVKKEKKTSKKILGIIEKEDVETYFAPKFGSENLVVFKTDWKGNRKERFTHSKIYIWDNKSAIGSVNFTKTGMWDNVETLWVTEEKKTTDEVAKAFQNIKSHPMMEQASIKEVAQYAHIPEEEIEKRESRLEEIDKKLQKKANEVIKNIFE